MCCALGCCRTQRTPAASPFCAARGFWGSTCKMRRPTSMSRRKTPASSCQLLMLPVICRSSQLWQWFPNRFGSPRRPLTSRCPTVRVAIRSSPKPSYCGPSPNTQRWPMPRDGRCGSDPGSEPPNPKHLSGTGAHSRANHKPVGC